MPATSRNASSIETCSTSGREAPQDRHHLPADGAVLAAVDRHEDGVRAERRGRAQRHRGAHAEAARLVRGGADDTAIVRPAAADDDGPAAQLGSVALLDGREERVEIDVQDGRAAHAAYLAPVQRRRGGQPLGSTAIVTSGVRPGKTRMATL